jgi:ribA/ribD-fused uncharacterized protein
MSDADSAEREGEEEVQLAPPQVQVQAQAEVKADEDLGVLGIVPQLSEEDPWWEKGVPEEDEKKEGEEASAPEEEEEGTPEETEEERADRKARRRYLKEVAAFYHERDAYFKMQRNKTAVGKLAFWKSFKEGKNDSRLATFGKDGTMTLFDKESNKPIHIIKPPSYHEPEPEDHEKVDAWRLKHIKSAETLFESAKQTLREAVAAGRHVKSAQRMALEADQALQQARFATKGTQYYKSVVMNQLLFDNKYDTHRTEVVAFVSTPMTSQQRYAVQDIPGEEEEEASASAESVETDFILFEKPVGDHDFLSSWYPQKFKYKGIKYRCAFQAIMAELARKFGDDDLAETVMEAREPEDMVVTWDELEGATERDWKQKLKKLILKVNRAKFEDETLAEQLVATGDKHLGCIPPEDDTDDYQGIGRSFDDPKARRRDKWKKGGNQYGKILEQIRSEIVVKRNPGAKRAARRSTKVAEEKKEEEDDEGEDREKDAGEEEEEEEVKPKTKGPSKEVRAVYIEEYTQALADGDKAGAARIAAQAKKAGVELPSAKVSKSAAEEPVKASKSAAKVEPVKTSKSAKKQTTVELEEE